MSILPSLQGIELKRVAAGEMAGVCPFCGGEDRFRVWPEKGRWWCRGCGKSGDEIALLREWRGYSYQEAAAAVGRMVGNYDRQGPEKTKLPVLTPHWKPKPTKTPEKTWQDEAGAFVHRSHEKLLADSSILQWLEQERGLSLETVKARRLGWNSTELFQGREAWGLAPELNDNGNPKKVWLPAGLVIPTFRGETLLRVRVRRSDPGDDNRYVFVPGSSNDAMVFGEERGVFLVVESELDGILINQEAGDIAGVVALGSSSIRPDSYTSSVLESADTVLVALDSDETGARESWLWWVKNFPKSERWPVIEGKDPTEAKKNGLPLREWIIAGLPARENKVLQHSVVILDLEELRAERAAIMEFSGNLTRDQAERLALLEYPKVGPSSDT